MLILLVSPQPDSLQGFIEALRAEEDVQVTLANAGVEALEIVKSKSPEVVILTEDIPDYPAKEMLMALLQISAMINMAIISGLPDDTFDDFYEGFGALPKLPLPPNAEDAREMLSTVRSLIQSSRASFPYLIER